jgi:hypothetical protein
MTLEKKWRVDGAGYVTGVVEKGNGERVQVGKPEGKIIITIHEYEHITSAVTRLNRSNSIVL